MDTAGHSRSKNGVASLAYVPAIHVFKHSKDLHARGKAGRGTNHGLLSSAW